MSRRRLRRKIARAQRHVRDPAPSEALRDQLGLTAESFGPTTAVSEKPPEVVVREASRVERLAYTRTQAAQSLGMGHSTFTQRVLPYVDTIETPWGTRLIPADELERVLVVATPAAAASQVGANRPAAYGDARCGPADP
jgi:hypothetical protein